ncbi:hypothetical protein [Amycolatopsis orientalis]|uniref:phage tail tube protein n=1 Tax=Amycolatopsis orientalis TaxID=31958 RepID=UPI001319E9B0|nr:hypothetical protein [Amycolatopsis orientalis]
MSDMLTDGQIRVQFVPTIADPSAPTVTELNAGVDLSCLITADGLDISVDEDKISIPKLCDTSNAEAPGRATYGVELTLVRKTDNTEDKAWTTLLRGTKGYLAIRYGVPSKTAFSAGDKPVIFPGAAGERKLQKPEANNAVKFQSKWFVSAPPQYDAAVVAGS